MNISPSQYQRWEPEPEIDTLALPEIEEFAVMGSYNKKTLVGLCLDSKDGRILARKGSHMEDIFYIPEDVKLELASGKDMLTLDVVHKYCSPVKTFDLKWTVAKELDRLTIREIESAPPFNLDDWEEVPPDNDMDILKESILESIIIPEKYLGYDWNFIGEFSVITRVRKKPIFDIVPEDYIYSPSGYLIFKHKKGRFNVPPQGLQRVVPDAPSLVISAGYTGEDFPALIPKL